MSTTGPIFSRHAWARAEQRFEELRGMPGDHRRRVLTGALMAGTEVGIDSTGMVHILGILHHGRRPIEFVIEPESGVVVTIYDPYHAEQPGPRRRRGSAGVPEGGVIASRAQVDALWTGSCPGGSRRTRRRLRHGLHESR